MQLISEKCVYFVYIERSTAYVHLYVDDVLVVEAVERAVIAVKQMLMNEFQMTNLRVAKSFLSVTFVCTSKGVFLRKEFNKHQVLETFVMTTCESLSTPLSLVRSTIEEPCAESGAGINRCREAITALLYISTRTRPDIAAAVGILTHKCKTLN